MPYIINYNNTAWAQTIVEPMGINMAICSQQQFISTAYSSPTLYGTMTSTGNSMYYPWMWADTLGNAASDNRSRVVLGMDRGEEIPVPVPEPAIVRVSAADVALADNKAEALLMSLLSPEQRDHYRRLQCFEVLTTRNGERRRYQIRQGIAGNIYRLDESGAAIESFCIHAAGDYPTADHMVAQMLMLQSNEEQFLRVANRTRIRSVAAA